MYRLLGEQVIDTEELVEKLKAENIRVFEDITRATKREDAVGLRILAPLAELGGSGKVDFDEEEMERLMRSAQMEYAGRLRAVLDPALDFRIYAYSYHEVEEAVMLNVAIMDEETGRRKLDDVIKRLFDV